MDDLRTLRLPVQVTPAEKATIKANAAQAGMTVSDYVRNQSLKSSKAQKPKKDAPGPSPLQMKLHHVRHELSAIGNNWNQLTRAYHRKQHIPEYMVGIGEELHRLLREIRLLEEK